MVQMSCSYNGLRIAYTGFFTHDSKMFSGIVGFAWAFSEIQITVNAHIISLRRHRNLFKAGNGFACIVKPSIRMRIICESAVSLEPSQRLDIDIIVPSRYSDSPCSKMCVLSPKRYSVGNLAKLAKSLQSLQSLYRRREKQRFH